MQADMLFRSRTTVLFKGRSQKVQSGTLLCFIVQRKSTRSEKEIEIDGDMEDELKKRQTYNKTQLVQKVLGLRKEIACRDQKAVCKR